MKNKPIKKEEKGPDLTNVISTAIQLPGVKVSREMFLRERFQNLTKDEIELIVEKGPVEAGCNRSDLKKMARRIIKERAAFTTSASFLAGLPGGFAMVATIPADMLQFYGVALRMAQELVYLYGEEDLWCEGVPDPDRVTNQLILYCGVMLGASGAAQTVRIMSSALAKQALKKLPQKALMKTFYYPAIKAVLKFFGISITKKSFATAVSKAIPIIGGVVSGGITLASILPMGNRLLDTLDKAHFDYTEDDLRADMADIEALAEDDTVYESGTVEKNPKEEALDKINRAKQMLDDGIITEEEFAEIKAKFISQI